MSAFVVIPTNGPWASTTVRQRLSSGPEGDPSIARNLRGVKLRPESQPRDHWTRAIQDSSNRTGAFAGQWPSSRQADSVCGQPRARPLPLRRGPRKRGSSLFPSLRCLSGCLRRVCGRCPSAQATRQRMPCSLPVWQPGSGSCAHCQESGSAGRQTSRRDSHGPAVPRLQVSTRPATRLRSAMSLQPAWCHVGEAHQAAVWPSRA